MKQLFGLAMSLLVSSLCAQTAKDSLPSPLKLSGYLETYYLYDFGNPAEHNRPDFAYSFNRHNEVNLNLGFLLAEYEQDRVRAKLGLMVGTYPNANLAAEPGVLKNIFEANLGLKLSKNHNLWLDAGVFASHIGFESAIGANCWNLTRSILADNSPYFLSGAKLGYTTTDEKWFFSALLLNGWQRIQRQPGNQTPAFGHQITWMPNEKISLNSSSFIGSDTPDSLRQMRYFHNFYGQFQATERLGLILGFDFGAQQEAKGSAVYQLWYSPVLIARYAFNDKLSLALRGEYYQDPNQVMVSGGIDEGFRALGYSANLDVKLFERLLWRIEGRSFYGTREALFLDRQGLPSRRNLFVATSLSLSF